MDEIKVLLAVLLTVEREIDRIRSENPENSDRVDGMLRTAHLSAIELRRTLDSSTRLEHFRKELKSRNYPPISLVREADRTEN